jgi:hypothetical protein
VFLIAIKTFRKDKIDNFGENIGSLGSYVFGHIEENMLLGLKQRGVGSKGYQWNLLALGELELVISKFHRNLRNLQADIECFNKKWFQ